MGEISVTKLTKELQTIVTKEIKGNAERVRTALDNAFVEYTKIQLQMLAAQKQLACDAAKEHEFEDAGGGTYGARFVDKCKHCGYENYV